MGKKWTSFNISDNGIFSKLNEKYITKRFNEFNSAYFSSKLSLDNVSVVYEKEETGALGRVTSSNHNVLEFSIGDGKQSKGGRTEKTWCEVILHEMIHVYQVQVLKLSYTRFSIENGHGSEFISKMEEINKAGEWNIGVTETGEQNETFILKKKSNKYLFSCPYNENEILLGLVKKSDAFDLLKINPNLECYKILEDNNLIDKLKTVKDKIKGIVKENNYIEILQSKGAIEDKPVILIDPSIRKNHYVLYLSNKKDKSGIIKLIDKKQFDSYKNLKVDGYSLQFYKILKGKYFVDYKVSEIIDTTGFEFNKDSLNDLLKKEAIEKYKFFESLERVFIKTLKDVKIIHI